MSTFTPLRELNDLDAITWHSDEAGGVTRTLSDFAHWTGGIEFTIVWDFDLLTEREYRHQAQHVRIFRGRNLDNHWYLYTLEAPHGKATTDPLSRIPIDSAVIDRIRSFPDSFANGVPTRRFAVAFYRGEI